MALVIFVAPSFNEFNVRAIDCAAHMPDVQLAVIGEEPAQRLPEYLRARLAGHWRVDDASDATHLVHAAEELARRAGAPVHRLFGASEQIQLAMAEARE